MRGGAETSRRGVLAGFFAVILAPPLPRIFGPRAWGIYDDSFLGNQFSGSYWIEGAIWQRGKIFLSPGEYFIPRPIYLESQVTGRRLPAD